MASKTQGIFNAPRVPAPSARAVSPDSKDSKDVPARILKKRESDRRCQRIKRERTKSKIAALEERVRLFGNQDPTGRIQLLMQQLQNTERERDDLAKKVKAIENVIRDREDESESHKRNNLTAHEQTETPNTAGSSDPDHEYLDAYPHREHASDALDASSVHEVEDPMLVHSVPGTYNEPIPEATASMNETFQDPNMPGMSEPSQSDGSVCECCNPQTAPTGPPQFNTWRFANQLLSSRFQWPAYFQMLQDTFRDDIPIRAIVEGWETVEARGFMHPSWLILKKFDQNLFRHWQPKERLAVMYATQLLLMSHTSLEALPELPTFYRKRPSQSMANNYAIHFFPWPGMRERFVFNQHRYCTNDFWKTLLNSLRIRWPFEFRDCYTRNVETGLYSISHTFEQRVNDINSWAAESEVFIKWPELAVDIPQYNSIPPAVSNMVQKPRRSKAPPRRLPVPNLQSRSNSQHSTISQTQGTPIYLPPEAHVFQPDDHYSRSLVYSMGGKTMPTTGWMDYPTQQIQAGVEYFAPTAPTNVMTNQ